MLNSATKKNLREVDEMMWGYYGSSSWIWMTAVMLLFVGGLIGFVIWATHAISAPKRDVDPALETLRQRLAAGQISQEDFDNTRRVLKTEL
jgi:uncharacterized membrane protein